MLEAKKKAAYNAVSLLEHAPLIGIGTGSTIECLIDILQEKPWGLNKTYVSSSQRSTEYLKRKGFKTILTAHETTYVDIYIDGADWIDPQGLAIKGYGAALFQEKLLASMAEHRIAVVDTSKQIHALCNMHQPLPIEVVDIARSFVARKLTTHGARIVYREGVLTDQGHPILDIYDWAWENPIRTEQYLKSLLGVVESGLFAQLPFHQIITE